MALALTTQLNAVNTMLSTIGEAPFDTLDGELTTDGTMALNILEETSRKVQGTGWFWNTDPEVVLTPDGDGLITLGSDVVAVDPAPGSETDPVLLGNKLYNRVDRTFVFTDDVTAEVQYLRDWDYLPEPARQYIMVRAARIFQDRMVGNPQSYQYTATDEQEALRVLRKFEAKQSDANIFRNDPLLASMLRRSLY